MHLLLMYTPHKPSQQHVGRLRAMASVTRVTVASDEAGALQAAPTTDVILGHRYLRQCLPAAEHLQWVQSTSGGVDRLPCKTLAERRIRLARYTGSAPVIARHAVTMAWAITRRIPSASRQQSERRWDKDMDWLPRPENAVVLGTGSIGRAIARLLQQDGISITGVKRIVDEPLPGFDTLRDERTWDEALSTADWCFVALPHTPGTRNMVDEDTLDALPSHAVLVNVGRGETVDLEALTRALEQGRLGGAALDVVPSELEPLDASSRLWDVPRLLLTPHVAAYHPRRGREVEQFCERQVRRYLAGQPLIDEVTL